MSEESQLNQRRLLRHQLADRVDVYDAMRDICIGRLVNIHAEGLMVMGDVGLEPDKLYQLHLRLPRQINGREYIQVGVDCLWARNSDDTSKHWAGCQIIDISPEGLADLESLVELLDE